MKLQNINSNYKFSLLIFGKRISQLVYKKLNGMENILKQVKAKSGEMINKSLSAELDGDHEGQSQEQDDGVDEDDLDINNDRDPETDVQLKHLKLELANLEKQTLQSKMELEQWRQEAKTLENMLRRPDSNFEILSDIQSDVISRRDESVTISMLIFSLM